MKYKYIVGLLVALSLNNAFAAGMEERYQDVYGALRTTTASPTDRINAALENNEDYDNKKDSVLWRSILAGFELRKTVFELNATELETIVKAHNAFFKTSLGMSLIYGWTLKHFAAPELPYYIVGTFSFGKHFNLIADRFTNGQTRDFLKSAFTRGLEAVNADQDTLWEFYSDAISALCVVESIGSRDGGLSMDGIIEGSYLTKAKPAQSVPTIAIDDNDMDDINPARHLLETELEESIGTYYDEIKDQFSGEFVSGENMIKLQHLVDLIQVGAGEESGVLRSIPVEENTVFSLNARLIGPSGNILNFNAGHELKTLRQLCNYLLGLYAEEEDDRKAVEVAVRAHKKDIAIVITPFLKEKNLKGGKKELYFELPKTLSAEQVKILKKLVKFHQNLAIESDQKNLLASITKDLALKSKKGKLNNAGKAVESALIELYAIRQIEFPKYS
jgi:hypothetical protein